MIGHHGQVLLLYAGLRNDFEEISLDRIPLYASELLAHVRERYPQLLHLIASLPPQSKLPHLIRRAIDEIVQEFNSRLDEDGHFVPPPQASTSSGESSGETRPEVEQLVSQLNRVESEHSRRIANDESGADSEAPAVGSHIKQVLGANAADAVLPKDDDPKRDSQGRSRSL